MQTIIKKVDENCIDESIIEEAGALLKSGALVAFPTETVYGLGANALDEEAAARIYAAKGRPSDYPLIVHIADMDRLFDITEDVPKAAVMLAEKFWPGPLTMVLKKNDKVPYGTTGGLDTVAVRMPSHKVALEMIRHGGGYIAAPSANTSGRPSPTLASHVADDLDGIIPMILDGGAVGIGIESTIVDLTEEVPTILRPGFITREMLQEVVGEVHMDQGLMADAKTPPKAPGMKYRHYAPKEPVYLLEGEAVALLPELVAKAVAQGIKIGVLCSSAMAAQLPQSPQVQLSCWGDCREQLAGDLFYLLRDFDRTKPEVILAQGVSEDGIGLAIMNRLRKAAGYQIITLEKGTLILKNGKQLPGIMIELEYVNSITRR